VQDFELTVVNPYDYGGQLINAVPTILAGRFPADSHRGDGKRFMVRADEKLTAFLELASGD